MAVCVQIHGPGVARSGWGRYVEAGIFEFRLRINGKEIINLEAEIHGITDDQARERFGLGPSEDVLLRVFCTTRAGAVVMLLHSYDKGEDPSKRRQQKEIAEARRRRERRGAARRGGAQGAASRGWAGQMTSDVLKHMKTPLTDDVLKHILRRSIKGKP